MDLTVGNLSLSLSWQPSIMGLTMGNPNRTRLISIPKWRNKANKKGAMMEAAKHLRCSNLNPKSKPYTLNPKPKGRPSKRVQ
jgi:hypothetical protein